MEFLKPCPFCGGKNIFVDGYEDYAGIRWRVVCLDCMSTVEDRIIRKNIKPAKRGTGGLNNDEIHRD